MTVKFRFLMTGALMACFGCLLWTITTNGALFGAFTLPMETAQEVTDPVYLKTSHGTFDLTAPPTRITGIPKAYKRLKSDVDADGNVRHLVRFSHDISDADLDAVIAAGGKPNGYMPNNVLVVSAPRELNSLLHVVSGVVDVRERPPCMSLDPYLMKWLKNRPADQVVKLVVGGRNFRDLAPILEDMGIPYEKGHAPIVIKGEVSDLKKRIIPMLLRNPNISYVGRRSYTRVM
jgi:hypothetical protein